MQVLSPAQRAAATRRANLAAQAKGASVSLATLANSTSIGVVNHAAKIDISKLSYAELKSLNLQIVGRLKQMYALKTATAIMQFAVGQRVKFTTKSGLPVVGKITGLGTKNVVLIAEGIHTKWRVAPSFLSAA